MALLLGCAEPSSTTPDSVGEPATESTVATDAYGVRPLFPGMRAPAFEAKDSANETYVFDPETVASPVIMAFYRGGWCPYCNLQLAELREMDDELASMGYDLLFLSADRPYVLSQDSVEEDPPYKLLSDSTMSIAKDFGIAFRLPDATVERYRSKGLDLAEESGLDHRLLPAPSVFIIGSDGEIKFQYTNPDYRERIPGLLLLEAARIFSESEHSTNP